MTQLKTPSLKSTKGRILHQKIKKDGKIDIEELELELIDAGLQEIENTEEYYILYSDYTDFGNMSKIFEEKGIEPEKSTLKRIPNSPVEYTEEQLVDIEKMLDKIEDDDDVQNVFTNIE